MLIDSHAHLDDDRLFGDADKIVDGFEAENIGLVINASCDFKTQERAVALAEKYDRVYTLIGTHPHEAKFFNQEMADAMTRLSAHRKVVGVGEIGLDFYYGYSPAETQKEVFVRQILLANSFNLPVVLHIRDAFAEALEILKGNAKYLNNGVLLHCYSGSAEMVREFLRFDCYFSFGGPVTFKNSKKEEIIKAVPVNRLLTETDCPYLTPEPFRGRLNYPQYVKYVLAKIAGVLKKDVNETEEIVKENTLRLFKRINL